MEPMKAAPSPSPVPPEPAESPAEEKDDSKKKDEEENLFRCTDYTPESLRNQQPMFDLLEQY